MFKRIIIEDWNQIGGLISFILTFGIFASIMLRAWRMKPSEAEHMASLALEEDLKQKESNQ
ncbi:hypothetical protein [Persicirhabdus sediminis]|uniref:Uncharacterized protein n=1 Tax=Persicirhabdus sediminis TaxID=454144 RepID=A0A8J7MCG3_9BACT|nr:hypothetical protein [Persicirhabdus sediminis]MBK1789814.1 hypothetical protein [Persicirhabdus sediminis]